MIFKTNIDQKEKEKAEINKEKECLNKKINDLIEFRAVNGKFNYLGLSMIVISHSYKDHIMYWSHHPYTWLDFPELEAKYVDKAGHIKMAKFSHSELPALISENQD